MFICLSISASILCVMDPVCICMRRNEVCYTVRATLDPINPSFRINRAANSAIPAPRRSKTTSIDVSGPRPRDHASRTAPVAAPPPSYMPANQRDARYGPRQLVIIEYRPASPQCCANVGDVGATSGRRWAMPHPTRIHICLASSQFVLSISLS